MSVSKSFEDDEDDFNESSLIHTRIPGKKVKVTQINYVSRNQLHSTASFNFGFMGRRAKHCWALSTNFLAQLYHVLLLAELAQKFKFLQNSCMAK